MTVISTLQQLTLQGAASTPGYALAVGEERKRASHAEACRSVGVSLWSLSLWVDGVKRQLTPSPVLVVYWVNVWESLLVNLSDTFSSDVLYLYGEATRPSGFVVIPFTLRQLMVSYD